MVLLNKTYIINFNVNLLKPSENVINCILILFKPSEN